MFGLARRVVSTRPAGCPTHQLPLRQLHWAAYPLFAVVRHDGGASVAIVQSGFEQQHLLDGSHISRAPG